RLLGHAAARTARHVRVTRRSSRPKVAKPPGGGTCQEIQWKQVPPRAPAAPGRDDHLASPLRVLRRRGYHPPRCSGTLPDSRTRGLRCDRCKSAEEVAAELAPTRGPSISTSARLASTHSSARRRKPPSPAGYEPVTTRPSTPWSAATSASSSQSPRNTRIRVSRSPT